jgi:hypothetical protein
VPGPRTVRFGCPNTLEAGADDRFWTGVLWYRPAVGMGRKVGVVGREMGVAIELAVLVVAFVLILLLPSEVRDCGLRMPVGMLLWSSELGGRFSTGDCDVVDAEVCVKGRKADGAVPPDLRLMSLLGRIGDGDGESSKTRTQPGLFPTGVDILSSRSILGRLDLMVFSGECDRSEDLLLDVDDDRIEGPAFDEGG